MQNLVQLCTLFSCSIPKINEGRFLSLVGPKIDDTGLCNFSSWIQDRCAWAFKFLILQMKVSSIFFRFKAILPDEKSQYLLHCPNFSFLASSKVIHVRRLMFLLSSISIHAIKHRLGLSDTLNDSRSFLARGRSSASLSHVSSFSINLSSQVLPLLLIPPWSVLSSLRFAWHSSKPSACKARVEAWWWRWALVGLLNKNGYEALFEGLADWLWVFSGEILALDEFSWRDDKTG